jgi:SAM-dependent methyltransferase
MMNYDDLKTQIGHYYTEKLGQHGPTPQGVDWNSQASQTLRFHQLLRGLNLSEPFSLNDLGCGYGALAEYLSNQNLSFEYHGYDLSSFMIQSAQERFTNQANIQFKTGGLDSIRDYTVASGIFNVKLNYSLAQWEAYIQASLLTLKTASKKGFSFNLLTAYNDNAYRKDHLYYANPGEWLNYCMKHFSKKVILFHDYPLYEFTLCVLQEP